MDKNEKWMELLTMDDLPERYRGLAEIVGIVPALRLCRAYGGAAFYVPMADAAYAVARDKMIREAFARGESVSSLARKYSLAERSVQRIVESIRPEQTSMFE